MLWRSSIAFFRSQETASAGAVIASFTVFMSHS